MFNCFNVLLFQFSLQPLRKVGPNPCKHIRRPKRKIGNKFYILYKIDNK